MLLEKIWLGVSNRRYRFQIYPGNSSWPYWSGIYMLCSQTELDWNVHYINACNNLHTALTPGRNLLTHSSALCASHVHILLCSDSLQKQNITIDLITALRPCFNRNRGMSDALFKVA